MNKQAITTKLFGRVLTEAKRDYPDLNDSAALMFYYNAQLQIFIFSGCQGRQKRAWTKMEEINELAIFMEIHKN
jgi:hypothetical protein